MHALAAKAQAEHAQLVAYERPAPVVARGDETTWPDTWFHELPAHTLTPSAPGHAVAHIAVAHAGSYQLWLGGSFSRGFEVSVDGRHVGDVKDQLLSLGGYAPVANVFLTPGVHTLVLTYPTPNLTPGSANNDLTTLAAITLQPQSPPSRLLEVAPSQATRLCGRPLDWIELVTG